MLENYEEITKEYSSICGKYFTYKEKTRDFSLLAKENKNLLLKIETLENFAGFDKLSEKQLNYYEEIYLKVFNFR